MLSLILFRHGKSDWDANYASDHERPLAPRGKDAARVMGRALAAMGQIPDLAISSSALRARDTLQLAARAGRWRCPMRIESTLYENTPHDIIEWIAALDETPETLLLTGHEPTWSALAAKLIGGGLIRVPTGSMLRIDFDIEAWKQIGKEKGELRWLLPPKTIGRIASGK
ncbi:SixA phosphatase family protein [Thiosocius teredinicola]|uniref:SixA phosphatase family protein n=1 Tax=Thiosocius teredinicola TaxID=1973002 RepID=UPI000990CDDE